MNVPAFSDRRTHPRRVISRPCKVLDRRTAVYSPGQTADLSAGGALIRVDRVRPFGPGDEVELLVAWGDGAVVSSDSKVRAVVRRVTPIDHHHQALAVQFAEASAQTGSGALAAAAA
jgi:hypothetical protein